MLVAINGQFLLEQITGVQRVAFELVKQLDAIAQEHEFVVIAPEDGTINPAWYELKLKRTKLLRREPFGRRWAQRVCGCYTRKHQCLYLDFCNGSPIPQGNSIVLLHDLIALDFYKLTDASEFAKFKRKYYIHALIVAVFAKRIVTVSEYSKKRIIHYFPFAKHKVSVIGNGWQHVLQIVEDDSILAQHQKLKPKGFYLALSSRVPHKNFEWIIKNAKKYPQNVYAIGGGTLSWAAKKEEMTRPDNIFEGGNIY